jgi:acid phosphatase
MENQSVSDIIGSSSAPYQTQLSTQYEFASQSYGLGHESLDNYVGFVSGNWYGWSDNDCSPGSGCRAPATDTTLTNQFDTAKISWRGYLGSMTKNAETHDDNGKGNGYVVRHDPFVYFPTLSGDTADVVPAGTSANWDGDANLIAGLNAASPPDFVWYSPSICQDGGGDSAPNCKKGASIAAGDAFLSKEIPAIQATNWYRSGGTIILTYDEGDGGGTGERLHGEGNHIPTTIISAATKGAASYPSYVNHWGVLGGIEQSYGLPFLGDAATPATNGRLPLATTAGSRVGSALPVGSK